jgi:hypothetical protein
MNRGFDFLHPIFYFHFNISKNHPFQFLWITFVLIFLDFISSSSWFAIGCHFRSFFAESGRRKHPRCSTTHGNQLPTLIFIVFISQHDFWSSNSQFHLQFYNQIVANAFLMIFCFLFLFFFICSDCFVTNSRESTRSIQFSVFTTIRLMIQQQNFIVYMNILFS